MDFDAVVLAGGGGTRLGGVDKAGLEVGGVRLLDRVLAACAGARHTVVVGAPRPTARMVEWTLEQPPGGGPMAGLVAGLAVLTRLTPPNPVLVLATDLPWLSGPDVERLLGALGSAGPEVSAAVFVDGEGHRQYLTAVYRPEAVTQAISQVVSSEGSGAGWSVRAALGGLAMVEVPDGGAAADVDTAGELAVARARLGESESRRAPGSARRGAGERRTMAEVAPKDQVLHDWVRTVCAAQDLDPAVVDVSAILDLAKDAAHGIARPAAPLTTFMAGYLAGRAGAQDIRATLAELTSLIPPPPDLDTAASSSP